VPNIGTAPAIQQQVIAILKAYSAARGHAPFTVVDLGSGDGKFTREIARSIPEARVTGLETARQSYLWSKLLKHLQSLGNLDYKRQDFFSADLSQSDVVIMYQSVFLMERIGRKLNRELKKGAIVACNRFPLGDGWQVREHLQVKTFYPHQKDLYVYEKA
jgi:16S rRNA A1518/A1519 N6-dimethyltransferase RsmA/KsgA/DIM1 with predicted DNA glycosylase/AP lyase activity